MTDEHGWTWRQTAARGLALIRQHPLLAALFVVGFVAQSVPIWITELIPQGDIYQHLAIADVIHNYDAPGSIYPDYFRLPNTIKPNLVYYYAVHWLGYVMPLETANKVFLNVYALLLPLSMLAMLRAFGRPRRLALFGFLFIYTGLFRTGFAGYLLSIPLYFFGIAGFYRYACNPTWSRGIRTALLASLLFFTHAQMYLMYMLTVGLMSLLLFDGWRRWLIRVAAPAASLAFFVPWFLHFFVFYQPAPETHGFIHQQKGFGAYYHRPEELLGRFHQYLFTYFRDAGDEIIGLLAFLLMAVGLILRGHREGSPVPGERDDRELPWQRRYLPEMLSLLVGASIFLLPVHIRNQAVISVRHIPLFIISLIPWLGWFPRRHRFASAALAILVSVLVVGQSAYLSSRFLRYEKELDGYHELFRDAKPWGRLYKVSGNRLESRLAHGNVFWHLHYNYMTWKGGVTDVQFAEFVTCPVRYRPGMIPPQLPSKPHTSPKWRYYDYFLVQRSELKRVDGLKRWLRKLSENRDWVLFERRDRAFERWWDLDRLGPPVRKSKQPSKKS